MTGTRPDPGRSTRTGRPTPPGDHRMERVVLACFGLTFLAGIGLLALYAAGGNTQLEGVLLALALGGLGAGIVLWAQDLMSSELREEERHPLGGGAATSESVVDALTDEAGFSRRRMLQAGLVTALGGLAAALAIPVLSLGPAPGRTLFETPWKRGLRLVGYDGEPVHADLVPDGGVLTVFPEGSPGSADGQALLIHAGADRLALTGDAAAGAPNGFVVYSKVCTHAGCPVGLYRASQGELICPCHQSTFDVLHGANVVFGPAVRALPQLPVQLEADGTFTALGDFSEPVGPSFWDIELGEGAS